MHNRLQYPETPWHPARARRQISMARQLLAGVAVMVVGIFGGGHARGDDTTWTAGSGNFTDIANWNNGSPESKDWLINNGGTAELSVTFFPLGGFLGFDPGQSGNLTVLNNGYLFGDTNLAVGRGGSGILTIEAGGRVNRKGLFIAAGDGSQGLVQIDGGELTLNDILHIGYRGAGNLTLTGNGTITSNRTDIGGFNDATGSATITNGVLQNTGAIFVGVEGNGTLQVNPQGTVNSESTYVGQTPGSAGLVTVSGGKLNATNTLAVGVFGNGTLALQNGGEVNAQFFQVGFESGGSGTATVSDNATLVADHVQVGVLSGSSGTLSLTGNSSLITPIITVAQESGSTGVVNATNITLTTTEIVAGNGTATFNLNDATTLSPLGVSDLTISGFSSGGFNLSGNVTFDSGSNTINVNNHISGSGKLIKSGSGALNISAGSSYSGGTLIQSGRVGVAGIDALGTGTIEIGTSELLALANSTIGSDIVVQPNQTITVSAAPGATLTLSPSSILLGSGTTLAVGSSGNTGTILFAPDDATALPPSGGVSVNFGTLQAGNSQLASLTAQVGTTTVAMGANLDFQDHLASGGINNLQGNGTVTIGSNSSTTLAVNSGNFSGMIAGAGGLVKNSNGTLILSSNSTFTGGTVINSGTLLVNGVLNSGLGTVEINAGGTLGGTGFVGPVSLRGGTLSPGATAGTFYPTEILWSEGVILFELGPDAGSSDFIDTGTFEGLGSIYEFTFVDEGIEVGRTYDLISFDPTLATAIPLGNFTFTNGGGFNGTFGYRSESASTSYLQFTVVPEPSTWALLGCSLFVLFAARKFRRV